MIDLRAKAPEVKAEPEVKPEGEKPAEGEKKPETPTVPEKYEFKLPEGVKFDETTLGKAEELFKKNGLSQEAAQELVSLQAEWAQTIGNSAQAKVAEMREEWRQAVEADKEMAGKSEMIKADIGRAISQLPSDLQTEFRKAMDFTGAGDHPAFVKAFWKLSQMVNEGKPTAPGKGPVDVKAPTAPRSIANAMYPNLPN